MAEQQTIKYAPQWSTMTVDNMTFQTNNVMGNFNYPPNVPAYKPIMKFLLNCPLRKAFTNYPSVVYQNFLREFWSTIVAYDPFPSTDETEKHPLREFLIKFSVLNGQRPLTLDFNTFCLSTVLDYNNGKYVDHPTPEAVNKELVKFANNPSYLDKTSVLKNSFLMAVNKELVKYLRKISKALFTRVSEDNWENHEEAAVNYANLKASIDDYYDENIAHRDQTDKLVEASM
ncbi:hypothetical protein Tco_1321683, partial [Tanacetum coccineum]